jgi:hypothetical protein
MNNLVFKEGMDKYDVLGSPQALLFKMWWANTLTSS